MPTRREVLGLPTLVLASSVADAQPRPKVVGVLSPYTTKAFRPFRTVILRAMRERGYVEDKHFVLVERIAEGINERLPQMAAELVALNVDVILASSTNAAKAAQQATTTIPIVFDSVADPVLAGFAQSVGHPGRNMTGLTNVSADLNPKRMQVLKQMVPTLSSLAVLANPANAYYSTQLKRMQPAADQLGAKLSLSNVGTEDDLEGAFRAMNRRRVDAFVAIADPFIWLQGPAIVALALKYRLPSMSPFDDWVDAGGLMSYGVNPAVAVEMIAAFVDKIFHGSKPQDLPIEQPTTLTFVVNRRTAAALGLAVPQAILVQVDRLVE